MELFDLASLVVLKLLLYSAVDDSWLVTARVIMSNSGELLMVVRVDIYITIGHVPRSAWTKRERSHCMFLLFCYMIMMKNNKFNFNFK